MSGDAQQPTPTEEPENEGSLARAPDEQGSAEPEPGIAQAADQPGAGDPERDAARQMAGVLAEGVSPEDLLHVRVRVWAEIGRVRLPLRRVLAMEPGQLLELVDHPDDPLNVYVNGRLYARGHLVVGDGEYAVAIDEVNPPPKRLFGLL